MKIYTKRGDQGETSLFGGKAVSKADLRVEAYGALDELNSVLGLLSASLPRVKSKKSELTQMVNTIFRVQNELFNFGAELATPASAKKPKSDALEEEDVQVLETEIDAWEEKLEPLENFILPGGCTPAALAHFSRSICRRAERSLIRLHDEEPQRDVLIRYLNRLGDHLFVMARFINRMAEEPETQWVGSSRSVRRRLS